MAVFAVCPTELYLLVHMCFSTSVWWEKFFVLGEHTVLGFSENMMEDLEVVVVENDIVVESIQFSQFWVDRQGEKSSAFI